MKRLLTFFMTLMLVVFATDAFAQSGPRRLKETNDAFTLTGNYSTGDIATLGGVKCEVLSDNMVKNWSFEDGLTGWTIASDFSTEIDEPDFEQYDNVPKSGKFYLVGTVNAGSGNKSSLGTAWEVEAGKTYYFSYWIKGIADDTDASWMKVCLAADAESLGSTAEPSNADDPAWVINGVNPVGTEWQQVSALFTVPDGYTYLQVHFRWLNKHWGFDDFELYEVDTFEDVLSDYETGDEVKVDGITYTLTSDNLIDNHSFELGMDNWYSANNPEDGGDYLGHPTITSDYFDLVRNGDVDENGDPKYNGITTDSGKRYLVGTGNTGADGVASLYNAWEIEAGQTYYFSFDIRALEDNDPDGQFIVTSLVNSTNTGVDENNKRPEDYGRVVDSGSGKATPSDEWKTVQVPFTNDEGYKYLQIDFRWLGEFAFDNFQLYKADPGVVILTAHEEEMTITGGAGTTEDPYTFSGTDAIDHWTTTGNNGAFEVNTWSTESDDSNISIPFIQNFVSESNSTTLGAATISHNTIVGLPAGNYEVSMDICAISNNKNTIGKGTTFNANGIAADISEDGKEGSFNQDGGTEVYGTYTLDCEVGSEGTLDISIVIPAGVTYNWLKFKNLKVEYIDTSIPVVEALTDAMDADLAKAMTEAIEAYEDAPTGTNSEGTEQLFTVAIDAIQAAAASAAQYAELTAALKEINLDEAGQAVWEKTAASEAYAAGTLGKLDKEKVVADIVEAVLAQVTPGSDMTYAMVNTGDWEAVNETVREGTTYTNTLGEYGDGVESYNDSNFEADTMKNNDGEDVTIGQPHLYKTLTGLTPGIYEVSFYGAANSCWLSDGISGDGIAQAYANDITEDITVGNLSALEDATVVHDAYLHTLQCVVNSDGTLVFGLQNIATGGNWYVAKECTLTLLSCQDTESQYEVGDIVVVDGVEYQIDSENLIDNHSFEQGVIGWYSTEVDENEAYFTQEISDENFAFVKDGTAPDGDFYIVGLEEGGKESPLSLGNYWKLDRHTNYYFSFYVKPLTSNVDAGYMRVSLTNKLGTETEFVIDGVNPVDVDDTGWMKVETVFRNPDYSYLQMMFRWLASDEGEPLWGLDNFQLYALTTPETIELVAHEEDFSTVDAAAEEFTHWTTTGNNGTFELNTWSTEAETGDLSGMTTPYIQNWVWEGDSADIFLTAATISHKQLVGLPAGDYEVSMDIRIFNEAGGPMGKGTTFNANDASEDLVDYEQDAQPGVYNGATEFYGNYKLAATVGEEGTLDINIDIPDGVTYSWLSFKNLKVTMMVQPTEDGDYMPVIEPIEGAMNADVAKAMEDAIAAYEEAQDSETFNAAIDAIQDAAASAEVYAEIAALVEALDETGAAVWATTESAAAYAAGTIVAIDEITADMTAAQAAQTTAETDWSYVIVNTGEWSRPYNDDTKTTTYLTGEQSYRNSNYTAAADSTANPILYKTVTDLVPGTYKVTFYAAANSCHLSDAGISGDSIAQAFANDAVEDVTVGTLSGFTDLSVYEVTLTCEVGKDSTLVFGLQNIAEGGNWYVAQAVGLTLVEVYVEPISDDEYEEGDEVEVGEDTVKIQSGNLFVNGGFNEAIGEDGIVPGWTAGNTYTDPLLAANVDITAAGGFNGGAYMTLQESVGAASEHTPTQAIAVTPGSTYLFIGYTKGIEPTDANKRYSALFAMQSATEEAHIVEGETSYGEDIITLEWGDSAEWTQTIGTFVATTEYVGMRMNWSLGSYDGLQLYEVETPQVVPGDYLVMVDGHYLAGGLNWGTKAMEGGKPQFLTFEDAGNGLYTIDSHQYDSATKHYLGTVVNDSTGVDEVYFDTNIDTIAWMAIRDIEDGTVQIAKVALDSIGDPDMSQKPQWIKTRGFQNAVELVADPNDATKWTLVTKADVLATMEEATDSVPVDVTALIPAAEPKRNNWENSWEATGFGVEEAPANYAFGQGRNVASVAESWHSTNGFDFSQVIPNLPVGTYKLTAQAFYRNDGGTVVPVMYVDDNTAGVELPLLPDTLTAEQILAGQTIPTDMVEAYQAFLLEEYPVETMFYVAEEGDVTVGFASEVAENDLMWTIFGELGLLYYGEEDIVPVPEPEKTGYEFVAEMWVASDNGRATADDITYNEDNTITVTPTAGNKYNDVNCIALGNNPSEVWATPWNVTTANMTISEDQKYFVIIGTDLSTAEGDSYVWWMNGCNTADGGLNYGMQVAPDEAYELEDGQVMLVWDISALVEVEDSVVVLNGGTCFGLTSTAEDHSATISDINFYTEEELAEIIGTPEVPEDVDYEIGDVVTIDEVEYTVVGDNLFVNGGFNEAIGEDGIVPGWTQGNGLSGDDAHNYQDALLAANVTITDSCGYNGNAFVTTASGGIGNVKTPTQAIAVEVGKTYMLVAYTSGVTPDEPNLRYSALFEMEDSVTEAHHYEDETPYSNTIIQLAWGATPKESSEEWTQTLGVFTATTDYVGMRMSWSEGSYDGFQLYEVEGGEVAPEPDPYIYDVTDLLANPSFEVDDIETLEADTVRNAYVVESPEGWTLVGSESTFYVSDIMTAESTATDNDFGAPGEPADGDQMLYLRDAWEADTVTLVQSVTLPAGEYKLTVNTKCVTAGASTAALVVGDESVALTINSAMPEGWDTAALTFVLEEETEVSLGIDILFADNESGLSVLLDNFQLWSTTEVEAEPEPEPEPGMEPGTVVHECEAEIDHWSIAGNTNGDFHLNTWSGEADASEMVVPFLEYWVGSWEGNLSAATISHETIEDLPEGAYEVTLDIRIFSEAGNEISAGTTLNANGEDVDLWVAGTDGVYGTETEVYGTYTVKCMVGEDGTLDICLDIPMGVSYNWISFKNLTVTYIGEELPADNSYQFVCTDWGSIDLNRVSDSNVTYDEESNTIIVTATGDNNVALSNGREAPYTTEDYTVSSEQNWFVVVGTDLVTDLEASQLWWMNGANNGTFYPDYIVELGDGEILVAWDLTATLIDTNLQNEENYLDGWTGFGLTSTSGVSVISDINFYTWKEAVANYPELATAIATEISGIGKGAGVAEGIYTLDGMRLSKITKSGIYIVDGKKVLVK